MPPFRMVGLRWLPSPPVRPKIHDAISLRLCAGSFGVYCSSMFLAHLPSASFFPTMRRSCWAKNLEVQPHHGSLLHTVLVFQYYRPSSTLSFWLRPHLPPTPSFIREVGISMHWLKTGRPQEYFWHAQSGILPQSPAHTTWTNMR